MLVDAALRAALRTPAFQRAVADLATFTEPRYVHTPAVRENWVIGPSENVIWSSPDIVGHFLPDRRRGGPALHLVGTSRPGGRVRLWLTNRTDLRAAEVIGLGTVVERTAGDLQDLRAHYGLLDFEGRSYRGRHHHMTLVSAAYTFA